MTVIESQPPAHNRMRRALTALPLAILCFLGPYLFMFLTIDSLEPKRNNEGFETLEYLAVLVGVGAALVVLVIPVVVLTLGRMLDAVTRAWGDGRAVLAFAAAGLVLGLILAVLLSVVVKASIAGTITNVALPAALGGLGTRLLLPAALAHRWLYVLSWVLAALPLVAAVVVVALLGLN